MKDNKAPKIKPVKWIVPTIYCYTTPDIPKHNGWCKIGYTERDPQKRIDEQTETVDVDPEFQWDADAIYATDPRGSFTDHDFHHYLVRQGVERKKPNVKKGKKHQPEWFRISPGDAKNKLMHFAFHEDEIPEDALHAMPYTLRDEQEDAAEKTTAYFAKHSNEHPSFLWNAKPRFGKTLTAYDLCKRMGLKNILVVTNRPSVANSWYEDYMKFFGPSSGYYFVSSLDELQKSDNARYVYTYDEYKQKCLNDYDNKIKGIIEFVSLQNIKGSKYLTADGEGYDKLMELSNLKEHGRQVGLSWDILIVDESQEAVDTKKTEAAFARIDRKYTLYLSGTPFKALAQGKFTEDAIFNWSYADEQKAKEEWNKREGTGPDSAPNPYETLPKLNLYTYRMSDIAREDIRRSVESDNGIDEYAFDLNEFFATSGDTLHFIHDKDVDKFLDMLMTGEGFPFSTAELREQLAHTFWILNRVNSAKALKAKLEKREDFKDYDIILAAGDGRSEKDEELERDKSYGRVMKAIKKAEKADPKDKSKKHKTITLSVGQLTTGVTVPQWTGVFILRNWKSASEYMQAAFRCQNSWLRRLPNETFQRKENAYVFDFDPARTLDMYYEIANGLLPDAKNTDLLSTKTKKERIKVLLNYFPVYGQDDYGKMVTLDTGDVLSIPGKIHVREVVDSGFMSNFLFDNLPNVFRPNDLAALDEALKNVNDAPGFAPVKTDENTTQEIDTGDIKVDEDGKAHVGDDYSGLGNKVFQDVDLNNELQGDENQNEHSTSFDPDRKSEDELKELLNNDAKPIADTYTNAITEGIEKAKEQEQRKGKLKGPLKNSKSLENKIKRTVHEKIQEAVEKQHNKYRYEQNKKLEQHKKNVEKAREEGKNDTEIDQMNRKFEEDQNTEFDKLKEAINTQLKSQDFQQEIQQTAAKTIDQVEAQSKTDDKMNEVKTNLRHLCRAIPSFLMAYGDKETKLSNFDTKVDDSVFQEVTGIDLATFRFLRDGGDYYERDENGEQIRDEEHKHHFGGHVFNENVFNESIVAFLDKKEELADWFNEQHNEDIFSYIPPQKTNQIFTPKKVVVQMVDMLEKENPGCFDDDQATFADLYVKSGMYITEIVKRLMESDAMKQKYPDEHKRLQHIFAKQIYGLAPTEIIYLIAHEYIFGFDKDGSIDDSHFKFFDTLPAAKEGNLSSELDRIFG